MTDGQVGAVCPQCGSAAAVHSIEELAGLAKGRLGEQQQGYAPPPQQGYAPPPQQGYAAEPQQGPLPGYAAEPRSGPLPGGQLGSGSGFRGSRIVDGLSLDDDLAGAALTAAARFIGRRVGRRVQRTYEQQVRPAMAAKQEAMLRAQIAIAERYPDLRACLTDQVVFLAGGRRVLPMASVTGMLTLEQADALVARLRES